MASQQITISLPDALYLRLQQAARATQQSFADVVVRAVEIGSPPAWDDAPVEYQAELAALDRLVDEQLWHVARMRVEESEMERYEELLDLRAEGLISEQQQSELTTLRKQADNLMLKKAHAAALLRWRGHNISLIKNT